MTKELSAVKQAQKDAAEKRGIPTQVATLEAVKDGFVAARELLSHVDSLPRLAIDTRHIMRVLKVKVEDMQEEYTKLTEKYAARDEDGKIVTAGDPNKFKIDEPVKFAAEAKALMDTTVEITVKPITVSAIEDMKFESFGVTVDALMELGLLVEDEE